MKSTRSEIRIATLYKKDGNDLRRPLDMATIRWLRISEALARLGYQVDIVANTDDPPALPFSNLRCTSFAAFDWRQYDVIKTLFHHGFDCLQRCGGHDHPFIISKLGSVVGRGEDTQGVFFFGSEQAELYATQERIAAHSRYVTVLTDESRRLWRDEMEPPADGSDNVLLVPTGVDREIPSAGSSPFGELDGKIAVYLGNIYGNRQREVNLAWQSRLNRLGRLLKPLGITLCFVGSGSTDQLDSSAVVDMGSVGNAESWNYQHFADVGIVFAQGESQHNESSKIYYYLRSGLPVVSEAPVPNNRLITEAALGHVVPYNDDRSMAEAVQRAATADWNREQAVRYVLSQHTWDHRVLTYDAVIHG